MDITNSLSKIETITRKACLSDFMDESNYTGSHKNNRNDSIQKNQKEYGHKKRIKP